MSPENEQKRRKFRRHRVRLPAEFRVGGRDYRGFVVDLSASGLFIQSSAGGLESGTDAVVSIRSEPAMQVIGKITRQRARHRDMATIESPGIGIRIESAPEEYYQLVLTLESETPA